MAIWTNEGVLLIKHLGWNWCENWIKIQFSLKKIDLKILSERWRTFCLGFNILTAQFAGTITISVTAHNVLHPGKCAYHSLIPLRTSEAPPPPPPPPSFVNIWNVNCARETAFIFDSRTDVLVKVSGVLGAENVLIIGGLKPPTFVFMPSVRTTSTIRAGHMLPCVFEYWLWWYSGQHHSFSTHANVSS